MIVAMQEVATEEQIQKVIERLVHLGFEVHRSTGARQTVLGAVGARNEFDIRDIEVLEGVSEAHRVSSPYKLVARSFRPEGTVVKFSNGVSIGGQEVVIMAGPCSVESHEQIFEVAEMVSKAGARFLRGGAFKPRSSPYSFQGMGEEALKLMRDAADKFKLLVISEVMEISQIPLMIPYVDVLQVGARNMQNFNLLRELNYDVMLCERGIRTFETYTRNTMDISAIPIVKKLSHLPMVADPSHGTGRRDKVPPMGRAAIAAGTDALLVEVHNCPDKALSDGAQSLYPEQFTKLMAELRIIAPAVGRTLA